MEQGSKVLRARELRNSNCGLRIVLAFELRAPCSMLLAMLVVSSSKV